MKKSLIALAALAVVSAAFSNKSRAYTRDVSYGYRMPAGFAGEVNRTHPASIFPAMLNATTPPRSYGVAVIFDTGTNTVKGLAAAQQSDATPLAIAGVIARPYPVQASSSAGSYGQQALTDATSVQTDRPNDVLEDGFVMVQVRGASPMSLTIDSDVYVFCSADEAGHVLGGFETAFIMGKTVKVSNAKYRGPTDSGGIGELRIFPAVS